jgi:hypothetical protein
MGLTRRFALIRAGKKYKKSEGQGFGTGSYINPILKSRFVTISVIN